MTPVRKWQLFFVLWLIPTAVAARPRSVNLEKELSEARVAAWVKIISYSKGLMKYEIVKKPKPPRIAQYTIPNDGEVLEFLDGKELASTVSTGPMTAAWPAVGTQVLVVVDQKVHVTLFAAKKGKNFRFWSPWQTEDIPIFKCDPPALPLPAEIHDNKRHFSNEGCLYPVGAIKEKM